MTRVQTSSKRLVTREATARAVELRKAGLTIAQIAKMTGASISTTHRRIMGELRRLAAQTQGEAAVMRELQLQRLEVLHRNAWRFAFDDALDYATRFRAIDRVLRIMERTARLFGLDAPVRQEVSGPDGGPIQTEDVRPKLADLMQDAESLAAMRVLSKRQQVIGANPAHPSSAGNSAQGTPNNQLSNNGNGQWPSP